MSDFSIINPESGRPVKAGGPLGRAILAKGPIHKGPCPEHQYIDVLTGQCVERKKGRIFHKECPEGQVWNELTGRCVNKVGEIGIEIMKRKENVRYFPKIEQQAFWEHLPKKKNPSKFMSYDKEPHVAEQENPFSTFKWNLPEIKSREEGIAAFEEPVLPEKIIESLPISKESKLMCAAGKIFNPHTSRCVNASGVTGKNVIKKYGLNVVVHCKPGYFFDQEYGCKKG